MINNTSKIFADFKEKMRKAGKVIVLPKDSPLRDILGIPYPEDGEVEPSNDKEE